MHVLSHAARIKTKPKSLEVVIHNHATNVVTYCLLNDVTTESLSLDFMVSVN